MNLSNYYRARYHCYCCCVHCPRHNENLVSRKCRSSRDPATARQQRPCFVRGQKLTAKKLAAGLTRRSAAHLPKSRALSAATCGTLGGCRDQGRATPTLRADSAHQFQGSARSTWGWQTIWRKIQIVTMNIVICLSFRVVLVGRSIQRRPIRDRNIFGAAPFEVTQGLHGQVRIEVNEDMASMDHVHFGRDHASNVKHCKSVSELGIRCEGSKVACHQRWGNVATWVVPSWPALHSIQPATTNFPKHGKHRDCLLKIKPDTHVLDASEVDMRHPRHISTGTSRNVRISSLSKTSRRNGRTSGATALSSPKGFKFVSTLRCWAWEVEICGRRPWRSSPR